MLTPMNTTHTQIFSKDALSDAQFDELCDLLDHFSDTFEVVSSEGLDGIAAAIAVMLRPVTLLELVPLIFGQDSDNTVPKGISSEHWKRFEQLFMQRVNHTARLLSHGELSDLSDPRAYQPWVIDYVLAAQTDAELAQAITEGEIPELAFEWALGFISAVEHFSNDWRLDDELLDDELNPMLSPFYALVLPKSEWPADIRVQDVGGDTREAWFAQAIWASYELWEYWRHHAPKPKGITVVKQALPGRNEPCHCGSGKKFKQCHG